VRKVIFSLLALCLLAVCLAGCQKKPVEESSAAVATNEPAMGILLENYLASVKAEGDAIKASLEQDPLTQTEMNQKSQELRELWDAALARILDEAKMVLTEEEMSELTAAQDVWTEATGNAVEAAGKDYEGGSMYALVVNVEAANLTEARVYELHEMLK